MSEEIDLARSTLSTDRRVQRVLTEGQRVVMHSAVFGTDGAPAGVAFDLWQITDCAIADHVSDVEPWADSTANGHTQIDGASAIDDRADPEETRRVARGAVQEILVNGRLDALDEYLAGAAYVQHNPRFADGVAGLVAALGALAEQGITMGYDEIVHVVAQGDFAYLHSTGHFGDEPYVFHDLFRVADGKCAEHWDVMVPTSQFRGRRLSSKSSIETEETVR